MGIFGNSKITEKQDSGKKPTGPDYLNIQLRKLLELGKIELSKGNYSEAKTLLDTALRVVKKMAEYPQSFNEADVLNFLSLIYSRISSIYFRLGDYASSLKVSIENVDRLHRLEGLYPRFHPDLVIITIQNMIVTYTYIADCYNLLGDHENALKYAALALSRCKDETNKWGLSELVDSYYYTEVSMARILCDMHDPEKALPCCKEFDFICQIIPDYLDSQNGQKFHANIIAMQKQIMKTGTYK